MFVRTARNTRLAGNVLGRLCDSEGDLEMSGGVGAGQHQHFRNEAMKLDKFPGGYARTYGSSET